MSQIECKTEEHIKQLAKELFFSKGCLTASTQEIADYAGVNRTLVNYYFRSKNNLFETVYWEIVRSMRNDMAAIYMKNSPFRDKIENIIDYLTAFRKEFPFIEVFNIQETVKMKNKMETIVNPSFHEELGGFFKEIEEQMELGNIHKGDPRMFFINLLSMVSYPIIMQPLFGRFITVDQDAYQAILKDQKKSIINLLFIKKN